MHSQNEIATGIAPDLHIASQHDMDVVAGGRKLTISTTLHVVR